MQLASILAGIAAIDGPGPAVAGFKVIAYGN
jgi:hypothetical protein